MVSQEHLEGIGSYDTKILRRMPMTQPAYIFAYYFVEMDEKAAEQRIYSGVMPVTYPVPPGG